MRTCEIGCCLEAIDMCSIPHGPVQPSACTARMKAGDIEGASAADQPVVEGVGQAVDLPGRVAVVELDPTRYSSGNSSGRAA